MSLSPQTVASAGPVFFFVLLLNNTLSGLMERALLYIFSSANCDLKRNITQLHTFHIWLNPGTADIVLLVVLGHHIK